MSKQFKGLPFKGKAIIMSFIGMMCAIAASAGAIHVSTSGNDNNDGSKEAPLLTIHKAVEIVNPGDRIWVHGGR